jgi:hypothetical protein
MFPYAYPNIQRKSLHFARSLSVGCYKSSSPMRDVLSSRHVSLDSARTPMPPHVPRPEGRLLYPRPPPWAGFQAAMCLQNWGGLSYRRVSSDTGVESSILAPLWDGLPSRHMSPDLGQPPMSPRVPRLGGGDSFITAPLRVDSHVTHTLTKCAPTHRSGQDTFIPVFGGRTATTANMV